MVLWEMTISCLHPGRRACLRLEEGALKVGLMQRFNEPNMLTTSSRQALQLARKNSLWPLQFRLACCDRDDVDRYGANDLISGAGSSRPARARPTSPHLRDRLDQDGRGG